MTGQLVISNPNLNQGDTLHVVLTDFPAYDNILLYVNESSKYTYVTTDYQGNASWGIPIFFTDLQSGTYWLQAESSLNPNYWARTQFTYTASQPTVNYYTLTLSNVGGVVTKSPNQATYASGTNVTLSVVANSGYTFTGWYDYATGFLSYSTTITIQILSNTSIYANFSTTPVNTYNPVLTITNSTINIGNLLQFTFSGFKPNSQIAIYEASSYGPHPYNFSANSQGSGSGSLGPFSTAGSYSLAAFDDNNDIIPPAAFTVVAVYNAQITSMNAPIKQGDLLNFTIAGFPNDIDVWVAVQETGNGLIVHTGSNGSVSGAFIDNDNPGTYHLTASGGGYTAIPVVFTVTGKVQSTVIGNLILVSIT